MDDGGTSEQNYFFRLGRAIRDRNGNELRSLAGEALGIVVGIAAVIALFAFIYRLADWVDEWNWNDIGVVALVILGGVVAFALSLVALSLVVLAIAIPVSYAWSLYNRR